MSAYRPYPKYKPSGVEWLGDVPEGWVVSKPKFSAPFQVGWTPPTGVDANFEGDNLWANISDLKTKIISSTAKQISDDAALKASMSITPRGALLYSFKLSVGAVAFAGADLYTNEAIASFLANRHSNLLFLYYAFQVSIIENASENIYGAKILNQELIRSANFALPPLPEQIQIAAFLDRECDKLNALQAKQERLIELLKEKRQALISHAVTRGLDPTAKLKPSGIEWLGDVPEHWQSGRIKTVSKFTTSGPRGWSEKVGETGALFVQSGDLNDVLEIEFASTRRVDVEGNAETSRTRLRDGDVVVCITGAKTGNVAVCDKVPEEAYINQHLCLIRPNRKVASRFVGTVLKSHLGRSYFDVSQYGLKQGLSLEDVLEAPMPLPPLAEQRAIVAHLDEKCGKIDQLKAKAERGIELLKERRSALISAAVTGKIDVREESLE